MNKLLILAADAAKYCQLIQAANFQSLDIRVAVDTGEAESLAGDCNIILGDPPLVRDVLSSTPKLEWIQSTWAGVDQLCSDGLRRDYTLTGLKGIFGKLISEYVMTYLFAHERRVFTMRSNQLEKRWKPLPYRPARGIRLGIVGLGSIGQQLARTAGHFGIRVTGLNRSGMPCDGVEQVFTADGLGEFLRELDYVVVTLPDTRQTRGLFNTDVFRMMKSSAVIMNVGRGGIIDETDLVSALRDGIIAGAVLDVFASEPLPTDSPLWRMPNVFITPHNAATSFPEDVVQIFGDNYQRFVANETLRHGIDFELGY